MKIANIEGTTEEIKNFFQDNGLKAVDFFEVPDAPIKTIWLVIPAICVFITLSMLLLISLSSLWQKFVFMATCFFSIWWSVVLQLRYRNPWATGFLAFGCLLLALLAIGVVTPLQMLHEAQSFKK